MRGLKAVASLTRRTGPSLGSLTSQRPLSNNYSSTLDDQLQNEVTSLPLFLYSYVFLCIDSFSYDLILLDSPIRFLLKANRLHELRFLIGHLF
jgi:hypothetical protein